MIFLKSLSMKNFKTFSNGKLEKLDKLTVLIGENGVGKSNALSVFDLLLYLLNDKNESIPTPGNMKHILHKKDHSVDLELQLGFEYDNCPYIYILHVNHNKDYVFNILKEVLIDQGSNLEFNLREKAVKSHNLAIGNWSLNKGIFEEIHKFLISMQNVKMDTFKITKKEIIDTSKPCGLLPDGSNLSSVIFWIYNNDASTFRLMDKMLHTMIPYYKSIFFKDTDKGQRAYVNLYNMEKAVSLEKLSTGTLRLFFLITLLCLPIDLRPSLLILEDPEIKLHPYVIQLISDLIDSYSLESQIIISTQSSIMLNQLKIKNLYLLILQGSTYTTKIVKVDMDQIQPLLTKYTISDLWIMNLLCNNSKD